MSDIISNEGATKLPDQSVGDLAESMGSVIGDLLPDQVGFVLLVFRGGDDPNVAGIAHATNTDPELALTVLNQFHNHARQSMQRALQEEQARKGK